MNSSNMVTSVAHLANRVGVMETPVFRILMRVIGSKEVHFANVLNANGIHRTMGGHNRISPDALGPSPSRPRLRDDGAASAHKRAVPFAYFHLRLRNLRRIIVGQVPAICT
ncbi:hypothetical protein EVAR_77219_1 [Eumeta japonica]|uniref:Uncharacterized protein n=1 Tax=Eumeta variegata TaxID=151549 RepID=A0A4C1T4Q4_EUMVA|nr:hypothetical protein EVAR_77219_1 [Eumeta japonica]